MIVLIDRLGVQPIAPVEVSVAIDTMLNFYGELDETVMLRLNISPLFPPPPQSKFITDPMVTVPLRDLDGDFYRHGNSDVTFTLEGCSATCRTRQLVVDNNIK